MKEEIIKLHGKKEKKRERGMKKNESEKRELFE